MKKIKSIHWNLEKDTVIENITKIDKDNFEFLMMNCQDLDVDVYRKDIAQLVQDMKDYEFVDFIVTEQDYDIIGRNYIDELPDFCDENCPE